MNEGDFHIGASTGPLAYGYNIRQANTLSKQQFNIRFRDNRNFIPCPKNLRIIDRMTTED